MGSFKKFLHHVDIEDVKKKHLEEIAAKKLKEERQKEEKEFIVNTMKEIKYDWRSSLYEKMSTGTAFAYTASGQPDADVATIDASLETSFGHDQRGVEAHGYSPSGLMGGVAIKPSGSGTGSDGGFDIGDHLAFTGDTYYNVRWAALTPVDSTAIDTITITAIRGNDSNGGEDPDASGEDLEVWYRNADMGQNMWTPINQDPAGNTISGVEKIIIPIGSDSSGLRDWTLPIPAHARTTSTQFMLFQATSSGAEYDHYGVTKISFKRNAPVNVVVSLDDPAASAFIRVGGPVGEKSDPKKRKKKVQDMLDASDEYVTKTMGENFPGTGVSLDPIEASPVGKDQVAKSFEKAGTPQKTIQQFLQTDDITGEPIEKKIEKSFSQFKPEVTPQGEPAPDPIPVNGNKNVVYGSDAQAMMTIDNETREKLKERGFKDKDIQRVLDAGGAEELKAVADGEVQAGAFSGTEVAGVNYDLDRWIDKVYGSGASNWYRESGGKIEGNPFIPAGSYVPKADAGGSPGEDIAQLPPEEQIAQAEQEAERIENEAELNDDEKQDKSEEEIKAEEEEKKAKGFEDYVYKESENLFLAALEEMQYAAFDVKGALNPFNILQNLITTALDGLAKYMFGTIAGWLAKIPGNNWAKIVHEAYTGTDWGKMSNSITIARSVMSGKVVSHVPHQMEIRDFANQLTPEWFTKGHRAYVPISDIRHEYADKNVYVERVNGRAVVRNNTNGTREDLTGKTYGPLDNQGNPAGGIGGHGSGYAQLIIPPDGSSPYVHYYDYNYHNLNNPYDLPIGTTGGDWSSIASDAAHLFALLSRLPHGGIQRAAATASDNFKKQFENLGNTDSFIGEGWPPGIHGAALTDFKVNLNELPQETQDMINAHPLSWTDERISKMTEEEIFQQFESGYRDPGGKAWLNNNIIKILEKNHIELDNIMDQQSELYEKKYNITDQPEYTAAQTAAKEYIDSIKENYKELIDNVEKEIPLPEGDYPEWGPENDPDIKANKEEIDKAWSTSQVKWDEAKPAMDAYSAHASTLELRGGYYYGTFQEIDKLKGLESKMNEKLAIWNRASDAWSALLDKEARLSTAYMNKLEKERKPWDDVYDKQREAKDKLYAERDEKVEAAQKAYEDTFMVRKGQDGKLLNGGDWKHPETGEVIPGMDTIKNNIQKEIDDLDKLMEPLFLGWYQDVLKQFKAWNWKTNYSGYGDGKSWTPKGGTSSTGSGGGSSLGKNKFQVARSQLSVDDPIVRDDDYASYRLSGRNLFEKLKTRRYDNRHPIVDIKKIKKKYDYVNKPSPDGFPENEPPQLDPKTGMHPRYGKNANRYGKLDPISAKAMARVKTGDPETDASVQKQAKKPK